jgi:hypothetical protein
MYELAGLNASSIAKTALAALGDEVKPRYRVVSTLSAESLRRFL